MISFPHRLLRAGLLIVAGVLPVHALAAPTPGAAVPTRSVDPRQVSDREQVRIRRAPTAAAEHGFYPGEEAFVQDVYARLMRYDAAGRKLRRDEDGAPTTADDFLTVALQELRTRPASDGAPPSLKPPRGPIVRLQPGKRCWKDDPCHVFYEVTWNQESGPVEKAAPTGPVVLVTTFRVTLTLAKRTQTYSALVLFHESEDGQSVEPEFFDPLIPSLQEVVGEESPAAVAPWPDYAKSARYAAIKRRVQRPTIAGEGAQPSDSLLASVTRRRDRRPIGYLQGDDLVSADIQMAVAGTGTPCEPAVPLPTGEYTNPMFWNNTTGIYQFNGQLTPDWDRVNFKGRNVKEQEVRVTSDTCYVPGVSRAFHLTVGNPWPVGDYNIYGFDNVGLGRDQIQAARDRRQDCMVEVVQAMWIDGQRDWYNYKTNTIRVGFTADGVFAERDGVKRWRPF